MTPVSRKIATLADYIVSIGPRLSTKLAHQFDEILPRLIDQQVALRREPVLEDYMTVESVHSGGQTTVRRFRVKGLITVGREQVSGATGRELRGFVLIAVGKLHPTDPISHHRIILPREWEDLIVGYGRDTVAGRKTTYYDVHVAQTSQLDVDQIAELRQLILSENLIQPLKQPAIRKRSQGRPTLKVLIWRVLVARWQSGAIASKISEEASEIAKELPMRVQQGERIPKPDSIESLIRFPYHRLKRVRKGVKYLSGCRLNASLQP
jgi:hypothetical protein